MSRTWVTSDQHFGHKNICIFLRENGEKLRPWDNCDDMDDELVRRYNEYVKPGDKCYFLGDVCINRKALATISRLNGDKVLIKGNHDIFKLEDYTKYFRDIRAYMVTNHIIFSHIPIHDQSKSRFLANVHGHTHSELVKNMNGHVDDWYINVCVERTDFQPVLLDDIIKGIKQ